MEVVVIGGGIVGAACALALARKNCHVRLIEGQVVGGGATAAGMGHLVVMDDSEAQFALTHYSRQRWSDLSSSLPKEAQYARCGTLWIAAVAAELEAAEAKSSFFRNRGVRAELLTARQLADAEPHLRPGLAGGLRVPDDAVVYPPVVCRWMVDLAKEQGAELIEGKPAVELEQGGVRLADGSTVAAEAVILAGGADSLRLLPDLPLRPRKGHLVITDRYPGFVSHQLIELGYLKSAHATEADSVAFNVQPRANGQLLLGSSRQYDVVDAAIDQPILDRMLARAFSYMPALARLTAIRAWTGFRASTADKLPLVGPHPARPGLWLATGHEGLGITTALGTADLLAAQMVGQAPPLEAASYSPARSFGKVPHG